MPLREGISSPDAGNDGNAIGSDMAVGCSIEHNYKEMQTADSDLSGYGHRAYDYQLIN